MIVDRLKQLITVVVLGSIILFLLVHLFQDPVGAAHVVGGIISGIGKGLSALWTFLSTLWTEVSG